MQTLVSALRPHCFDRFNIRFGKLFCPVLGMAHLVSAELALTADITLTGHWKILHKKNMIR